jgi:hypothetical protein
MFLALAPLVISYGLGYQYDFKKKEVIQTGAVVIKTIPSKANIFLDGELQNKNNFWEELFNDFVKINQLKIGKYNLKIKKNNYYSWGKNIEIKEGMVTKLGNVILLPVNPKIENVIAGDINNFWFSGDRNKIVYTVFGDQKNIILKSLALNEFLKNTGEFKLLALKTNSEINNLKWSENNKNIIFEIVINKNSETENSKFYLINLEENKIINLDKKFKLIFNKQWQAKSDDIFYLKNGDLYRINYSSQLVNLFLKNISAYAAKNNFIYYVKTASADSADSKTAVYRIKGNGLSDESLIVELPPENNFDKIEISAGDQIILKSKKGNLYLIENNNSNGNPKLVNSSVADFELSEERNRFFYFNDHEIWVYYLKEKTSQPAKEKYANELITRFSGEIKNVTWYSDFEHLFFQFGKTIKFIELDSRDKRNCFDFVELNISDNPPLDKEKYSLNPLLSKEWSGVVENQNNSLIFDSEKNKLYFLDKADGKNVLREVLLFP